VADEASPSTGAPAQAAPPYERIAPFYDALMAHVDYGLWADYVCEIRRRHAPHAPPGVFDAACGTGRLLEALGSGADPRAGADASAGMLAVARRRLGPDLPLARQDLRALIQPQRWGLVTCLYDSVNYLLDRKELELALRRLQALVAPGGLLVFDICTERNSLDHFLDFSESGSVEGWDYLRRSWYETGSRMHHNEFTVQQGTEGPWREHHRQRIYRIAEVETSLERCGLRRLAAYAGFGFQRGTEAADRVHFVVRPDDGSPGRGRGRRR
jgi:SAM-dependent methyltransferase